MTKTPEEMAKKYGTDIDLCCGTSDIIIAAEEGFLAGYKAGFEIGCMKGSMAMQWTLDDDYHLTPIIDHEKLAKVMTKKEIKSE